MTEDEMAGWHHRLDAPEFEETREIVKDGEAWRAAVHRVAQSQTCLRDLTATKSVLYTVRQFFTSGGQSIGVSASASDLPINIQD